MTAGGHCSVEKKPFRNGWRDAGGRNWMVTRVLPWFQARHAGSDPALQGICAFVLRPHGAFYRMLLTAWIQWYTRWQPTVGRVDVYSYRRAMIGSTLVARRAGM